MPWVPASLPFPRRALAVVAGLAVLVAGWQWRPLQEQLSASAPASERTVLQAGSEATLAVPSFPAEAGAVAPTRPAFPYAPGGDDILGGEAAPSAAGRAREPTLAPGMANGLHAADAATAAAGATAAPAPVQALALPDLSAFPIAAAADFFHDGRLALFTVAGAGSVQRASFLAADRQGRWSDRSQLLLREEDRTACALPRQALADDLNGDGRPDVYLVCGVEPPAACCRHQVFLSQPDGRYRRQDVAASWEGATDLRDVDGDGRLDAVGEGAPPRVLYGRGDGRFAAEPPAYGRK
jgi:hypothetical protein